jgi:hypothetical protein
MLKQKIELMLSTKEVTKVMRIHVASISLETTQSPPKGPLK